MVDMTGAQAGHLAPPTEEQTKDLQAWRAEALELMPYMASMLFSLRPVNAPGIGTFAVDTGHRLYVDFDGVKPRGSRWCAEALLHECGHLFGEHASRAEQAGVNPHERMVWNIAGDAEINDDLRDAGCEMKDAVFPDSIGQADYQTAEIYMHGLREQMPPQTAGGDGDGDSDGDGGDQSGAPDEDGNDQDQGSAGADDGQGQGQGSEGGSSSGAGQGKPNQPFKGCGSASGGEPAPCELGSDDLNGTAPEANPAERERTILSTAATIRDHHQSGRGTVPAGLTERAEQLLAPSKVPWRQVLSSAVKRAVAAKNGDFDTTYTRRNRRRHSGPIIYPGTFSPRPTLAVVRDTSGSMGGNELLQVSIEVDAIARKVGARGRDLRVLDVDAAVHEVRDYKNVQNLAAVHGRGGTDMRVGIDAAVELRPRPNAIVVVTDGGTPWPKERQPVPVVACIVGPHAESFAGMVPDWIRTVIADDLDEGRG